VRDGWSFADGSSVALEVSVVLVVVEADGGPEGPRALLSAAKSPPCLIDSAARESDVTVPGFSILTLLASAVSVGAWIQYVSDVALARDQSCSMRLIVCTVVPMYVDMMFRDCEDVDLVILGCAV
jgi:hypothetical protein